MVKDGTLRDYQLETLAVHAGQSPDPTTGSLGVPIYETASFVFQNAEHAAELYTLQEPGHVDSGMGNPTVSVLEKRIAALEGGAAAVAAASGQAAVALALLTLLRQGDELIASRSLQSSSASLLQHSLPALGIRTHFVDFSDLAAVKAAITANTRLVFGETIGGQGLEILDIEELSSACHEANLPLLVDNTLATPYLCRPLDYGADLVVHSATKWLGGHGTSLAGVVVDGGRFDWSTPRFKDLNSGDGGYPKSRFVTDYGPLAYSMRLRVKLLRDFGAALSPHSALLILLGLETLHLRMERHSANALELAQRLRRHPRVEWVAYPGLPSHPQYQRAQKYLHRGFGGTIHAGIRGGQDEIHRVLERASLWSHAAAMGDTKSTMVHPASTSHAHLTPAQRLQQGAPANLLRLSVGIEGLEDLWSSLSEALGPADVGAMERELILNEEGTIRWVCQNPDTAAAQGQTRPKAIAVVGLSQHPNRPSYRIARRLKALGYHIIPINPAASEVLGERCYPTLASVPETIDVIQVFRGSQHAVEVAREAAGVGARVFWLQEGVFNLEAARLAATSGYRVVMNRCIYKEVLRLRGALATYSAH